MFPRKTAKDRKYAKPTGMYLCHACGKFIEREAEGDKPLKKWIKSYCQSTDKNVRIWLKLEHNMPSTVRIH
jgi:hypothetical protein